MGCPLSKPKSSLNQSLRNDDAKPAAVTKPNEGEVKPSETVQNEPLPAPVEEKPVPEPVVTKKIEVVSNDTSAFGLLLCGAGESGKTTFTRQLRIRYLNGFKDDELSGFVSTIRGNLVESMQLMLIWLERNNIEFNEDLESEINEIMGLTPMSCEFTDDIFDNLRSLWQDSKIQLAYSKKDETAIPDHIDYFFNKIDEIAQEDYIPSVEDVLRARIRTIGIDKITFKMENAPIRLYDVGGQKSERNKWDEVINDIRGVVFCVSFADFDKKMFEDESKLRINDALEIFQLITHKPALQNAPFFLLCNKFDGFSEKVKNTDAFGEKFPDFNGNIHDPMECGKYLVDRFMAVAAPLTDDRPIMTYNLVALNCDDVVETTTQLCKFISEKYYA